MTSLDKSYGATRVLQGLSFSLQPGSITALVGANGAGKSTLISILLGLTRSTAGEASIHGYPVTSGEARVRRAFVLQDAFFPYLLSPQDCLRFARSCYAKAHTGVEPGQLLTQRELSARSLRELSGGQRRKVLIAAALIVPADLFILDEPTAMLDAESRRDFWRVILHLREAGKTILFSSHNFNEVERQADRVLLLNGGRVVKDGPLSSVGEALRFSVMRFSIDSPDGDVSAILSRWGAISSSDGRRWEVLTDRPEPMLAELFANGAALHGLTVEQPSLEDSLVHTKMLE
ncbi:MAG: ABC transporter ATP-binding protein [Aquidulcibacter sp.]